MNHRNAFIACLVAFVWLGACLQVPESEDDVDASGSSGSGGGTSSPTMHPSCARASAIDGVYCDSADTYVCTQLLVSNASCQAANGATTVPPPGALIWCCETSTDGGLAGGGGSAGSTGGSAGADASLGGAGGSMGGGGGFGGTDGGTAGAAGASSGGNGGSATGGTAGVGGSVGTGGGAGFDGGTTGCDASAPVQLVGTPTVVTQITGVASLAHLAVDSTHVYVATRLGLSIHRAPIAGGPSQQIAVTATPSLGVGVHGNNLYWTTSGGQVFRGAKDGASSTLLTTLGADALGIAADPTHAYVVRLTSPGPLLRVPAAGGAAVTLGTVPTTTRSVIVTPTRYIVGGLGSKLYSMPLGGGAGALLLDLGPGRDVGQLAYRPGEIWLSSFGSFEILRIDETCQTMSVARDSLVQVLGLAVSDTHVYFTRFNDNKVWSLPR